jgi:hypothetical protein
MTQQLHKPWDPPLLHQTAIERKIIMDTNRKLDQLWWEIKKSIDISNIDEGRK